MNCGWWIECPVGAQGHAIGASEGGAGESRNRPPPPSIVVASVIISSGIWTLSWEGRPGETDVVLYMGVWYPAAA